jgi:glycosyltransferase involved in cell wall biosynthesis
VVTTNEPSFAETVVDGESGIVVALESSDALAEGVLRLLGDPASAARLGHAAWQRVHALFDIRTNVEYMMSLYDTLLLAKSATAPDPKAGSPGEYGGII